MEREGGNLVQFGCPGGCRRRGGGTIFGRIRTSKCFSLNAEVVALGRPGELLETYLVPVFNRVLAGLQVFPWIFGSVASGRACCVLCWRDCECELWAEDPPFGIVCSWRFYVWLCGDDQ